MVGVWRQGRDGAWYVACHKQGLEHEEVIVMRKDGSTHVVTVICELGETVAGDGETLHLYDFERDDDYVD